MGHTVGGCKESDTTERLTHASCLTGLCRPLSSSWGRKAGDSLWKLCTADRGHRVRLECDPDIPVGPGEEHYVLDPSLDEDSLP